MKAPNRSLAYQFLTLSLGIGLLVWLFGRQDWHAIAQQFQRVDYKWAIPILAVTVGNYALRALRWQLLLPHFSFATILRALLVGYFVNLALPRVGEVARIWALQKDKPFLWEGLGTVVAERVLDMLCLVAIMGVFLLSNTAVWRLIALPAYLQNGAFWAFLALLGGAIAWGIWRYLQKNNAQGWRAFRQGLSTLWTLRRQARLWIYTALIWWTYMAMSYFWFFALPATAHLGWEVAFAMLALGTLSRVVPLQGNSAGAYHGLVVLALGLYGVGESPAFALALLIHSTQLLFNLFAGGASLLWLMSVPKQT